MSTHRHVWKEKLLTVRGERATIVHVELCDGCPSVRVVHEAMTGATKRSLVAHK